MLIVSSSLSLLAIVAGMFLYAKTIKDELNWLFKTVAYFIIIAGFLNLFSGCAFFALKTIYKIGANRIEMQKNMHDGCDKKMKKNKSKCKHMSCVEKIEKEKCDHGEMMEGCGEMKVMQADGCSESMIGMKGGNMSCMKGHMMMKKDSVFTKR